MRDLIHPLLVLLARAFHAQLERENRFLKLENQILRSKIEGRIIVTPEDRARLVRYGRELGSAIKDIIDVVRPATFMRWNIAHLSRLRGDASWLCQNLCQVEVLPCSLWSGRI